MYRNRLPERKPVYHLPQQPAPAFSPEAFVMVPVICLPALSWGQLAWQQWLYRQAMEQAQGVLSPSLPERDLLGVWN
jgi:hypothetical protein